MIKLSKGKFLEVLLEVEAQDFCVLKESLLFVCSGKNPVEMECIYDNGIFKGNEKFSHGLLSVFCSNDETLRKIDSGVVLTLDIESLQLIVDILDKIIHKKKYNPEICEILVPKRKKLMTIVLINRGR